MNPETLREWAKNHTHLFEDEEEFVVAAADAWDEERTTRHMEAAKFLSKIAAWKASCEAAEKRLEAAEKALRGIATMTNDMSADGQFTSGDAYYAQHLAVAALAGEEKP